MVRLLLFQPFLSFSVTFVANKILDVMIKEFIGKEIDKRYTHAKKIDEKFSLQIKD